MTRVAFIHTVGMLVERFRLRMREELPGIDCFHMLDESLLQDLLRHGPSPAITRRIVAQARLAEEAGAELIVFTCSSTSPAIDTARAVVAAPILKIDDPMYAQAVRVAGTTAILCTTSSTLEPSRRLFEAHAAEAGRVAAARPQLCAGAFDALTRGDREAHDRLVMNEAAALAPQIQQVVLAQASLAHLAEPMRARFGLPVLASPDLLMQALRLRLGSAAGVRL
jgi:Asp/Glu/hydantoin racemase